MEDPAGSFPGIPQWSLLEPLMPASVPVDPSVNWLETGGGAPWKEKEARTACSMNTFPGVSEMASLAGP